MTTCGWRPSSQQRRARVVEVRVRVPAGAHLLDRQVEDRRVEPLARRDHCSSSRQARERRLGDLELRRARLARAEPVLQLVARLRERARDADARGGASSSRRSRSTAATAPTAPASARGGPVALRRLLGGEVAGGRRERASGRQMRAAALVLLRPRLAVLVGADRDVLGAVVLGELAAAQRERRGREREQRCVEQLARGGPKPTRFATPCSTTALPSIAAEHARALASAARASGSARFTCGSSANASASRAGPRSSGFVTLEAARRRLRRATTFSSPSSVRMAHAQAVGPCTSTPFASAMPPSRTLSLTPRSVA